MRFVLLVGCLSLSACAVFVTVRLRSLNRKSPSFPPIEPRWSSPKVVETIR
jgi:hypothetical protein